MVIWSGAAVVRGRPGVVLDPGVGVLARGQRTAGAAHDQLRPEDYLQWLSLPPIPEPLEQQFHRPAAHFSRWLASRGEPEGAQRGSGHVVHAYDGHVLRNPQAGVVHRVHDAQRDHVCANAVVDPELFESRCGGGSPEGSARTWKTTP